MFTSDEQISPPSPVCKENSLHFHSSCADIILLPREFFFAKLGNFTISKRGLVVKFAHFSDVNTHKGRSLVIGS